ncbi:MAG TPA: RNA polymerase sigma factor [Solirubrobacteraceae bacterium]
MPAQAFHARPDHEIHALADEAILEHATSARAAGRPDQAARALQILAFGYRDIVTVRVAAKVPAQDVEDVADAGLLRAVASALRPGAFSGGSVGEFRSWMHTIVDRQVADYWRKVERSPREAPLPDEHEGEDGARPPAGSTPDETGAVDVQAVIEQTIAELSDVHGAAVEAYVFAGLSATETAAEIGDGMTENNVHQIAARFRRRVAELLDESS